MFHCVQVLFVPLVPSPDEAKTTKRTKATNA